MTANKLESLRTRLTLDVVATLGSDAALEIENYIRDRAPVLDRLDRATVPRRLADDVQQMVHDLRMDVVWPACPVHRHHPMTVSDDAELWQCPAGRVSVPIGQLTDAH